MFVIIPLIRMLARHKNGWVVLACGAALTAGGIGVALAGISTRQPAITRIGFLILLAAITYAVLVVRGRRVQRRDSQGPGFREQEQSPEQPGRDRL